MNTQPYLGESITTLNKFNGDDDDFIGNFDEDGSFIGDYLEQDEEQAQAVQNKLLFFQQMYAGIMGHYNTRRITTANVGVSAQIPWFT